MKRSRKIFTIVLSAILLCLITTTAIVAFAADNSVTVTTEQELIAALNDSTVNKVIVANDIEITEASSVEINGANKVMDGSNYKITFAKYFTFTANDFVQELKNIDFVSDSSVNLTLKYGGSLTNVDAAMMSISTNGTVNITDSHLKTISATNASKNTFVNSSFQGLTFDKCSSITVDGVTIVGTGNNYGIRLDTWCSGTIKNTSISNCSHGISADMNGYNATLENVTIENCTYGIYNHGDVNGSTLYLNGVTIKDATKYGIYCTGTNSNGSVRVKANSTLTLDLDAIGIYLKKGSLSIEKDGAVAHAGDYYTVFQDVNSYVSDSAEILNVAKESGAGQYYNVTGKVGENCYFSSVTVTTEEELQAAIADETISNIELANNITITQSLSVKGILKVFDGKGFALDFGDKTYSIYTEEYVEFKDLKLQTTSTSTGYISLSNGSGFDNVEAPNYRISTSGTIIVDNSSFCGVSISSAPKSKVLNTTIGANGISIGSSETCSIENVTIQLGTSGTGINLGNRSGTTIKNVTITGGYYGICADMNGRTATLENVTIENCTYGIYNHGDVNGSTLNLSGVTVKNATKYGIYCTGTNSNGSVRIKANSTLTLDLDAIGVYLKKGSLTIEKDGNIAHTGDYYTVFQDVNSYVYDSAEILNVAKENGAGQYYNVTGKVGEDCYFSSVIVTTEEELQGAIADETISNIELANNITITQSLSIKGILKVFDGKGFALDFGDKTYSIYTEEYVEFKNLKLQTTSTSTGYISLSNGSSFENVEAPNCRISTSGTITITDGSFYGVSISSAPKSKVLSTAIGAGGISIGSSEDHIIENVTITNGTISLGNRSRGIIKNTTIDGGSIYAALNGQTVTLENVTIKNSARYGIEIYGGVNGSTIKLKDVTIQNTGSYAIYCKGSDSSASIYVLENSTLTMEVAGVAIQLETGYMRIQGNISHVGEGYAVVADPKSTCSDSNHQLVLIDDPTTNSKLYLFKGNYDDKVAPELSLNGDSTIELVYGAQYTELGALAIDNIDGELEVVITGEVNTSREGEYTLVYTVTDYHGNTSTLERKIVVICNHDYDISIPLEPTCSAVGEKKFECTICGKIETETLPARGHYVSQGGKEMVDSYEIKNDTTYSFTVTDGWYVSSNHLDNTTSVFEIRAIYDCTLVLKYKVSSEGTYDKLIILHNSTTKDTISGNVSEKTITLTLKAGDVVYIQYTKDSSQSSGTDTGSFKIESCTQTEIDTTVYVSTDDIDPTCIDAVVCESCHQTMKAALGHTNAEAVVENRVEPDCVTDGGYDSVIYCSACEAEVSREAKTIDKLGHDHSTEWTEDVAPTCTTVGSKSHHCSRCDDKADVTEVPANGHSYGEWYETIAPTCTATGTDEHECSVCHNKETRTVDAKGHTNAAAVVENKTDATCTADGSYDSVICCSVCNAEVSREAKTIDKLGHDHSTEWTEDVAPTCTTVGSKSHHCSRCDDKADVTEIPANGHNYEIDWSSDETNHWKECACGDKSDVTVHAWNDGIVTKEATVDEEGVKTYTCTLCSCTKNESIAKLVTNVKDTESGVTLEIPSNSQATLPAGTVIEVLEKSNESISEQILGEFATTAETVVEALGVYDLNLLLDGVKIQPNGAVVVTLPAPKFTAEYDRIIVVFIADDGSYDECKTTVNADGTISFETDHFSKYAVIGVNEEEADDRMGVGAIIAIVVGAVLVVVGGAFAIYWFVIKKKNKSADDNATDAKGPTNDGAEDEQQ